LQWKKDPPLITIFTNSTTLNSREVRKTLANFDLVLAKLDAATQEDFIRTNRPHPNLPEISFIIKDLSILSQEMGSNSLTLQCLIYNSYREDFVPNSNQVNIKKLAIAINKIKPNAVQIYSLGRIPAEYFVYSIDNVQKEKISTIFKKIIKDPSINITFY
jgi:wyosine [tRNA(Phe)-imidazoG37] synthetase (radical SAM superfamily)